MEDITKNMKNKFKKTIDENGAVVYEKITNKEFKKLNKKNEKQKTKRQQA